MSTLQARGAALLAAAVLLVAAVLGVQVANGGGDFTPARAAPPCTERTVTSVSGGIDGLGERLVLLGLSNAACTLGVTREALTLQIAEGGTPTDAQVAALHGGLLKAVDQLKSAGTLPKASDLVDEALDNSDLNFLVKAAVRALPDSVVNAALHTDDVLRRTIDGLDIRKLLTNLRNPDDLSSEIDSAVEKAVKDSLIARLKSLI